MLLNTFAPPFKLVGGYFFIGIVFLLLSVVAFFRTDFTTITDFATAGFAHIFFVGFVMSIIIGALYQLTSVILESAFYTIRGAFVNLAIFAVGTGLLSAGLLFGKMALLHAGATLLFVSLAFFGATYFLSFLKTQKRSLAQFALLISVLFLLAGILLGFALVMILAGAIVLDFQLVLSYHIYFVLGFVFFVIVGVASVLLPMFALSHDVGFVLSKISLASYAVAGVALAFSNAVAFVCFAVAIVTFVAQATLILKKRVRKAWDYWSLNVALSLVSLIIAVFVLKFQTPLALWLLIYGFLYPFIVAHLYKIAPFLIWYHYVSPFVGKTKVPLLDQMILKKPAYVALVANVLGLLVFEILPSLAVLLMVLSAILVALNMLHFFKYTKFGVENER